MAGISKIPCGITERIIVPTEIVVAIVFVVTTILFTVIIKTNILPKKPGMTPAKIVIIAAFRFPKKMNKNKFG